MNNKKYEFLCDIIDTAKGVFGENDRVINLLEEEKERMEYEDTVECRIQKYKASISELKGVPKDYKDITKDIKNEEENTPLSSDEILNENVDKLLRKFVNDVKYAVVENVDEHLRENGIIVDNIGTICNIDDYEYDETV